MPSPEFKTLSSLTRGAKAEQLPTDLRLFGDTRLHILGIRRDLGSAPVVGVVTKPNGWEGSRPTEACIVVLFRTPTSGELASWGQTNWTTVTAELLTNDGSTLIPSGRAETFAII